MILTADNCEKFISTIESLDGLDPFAQAISLYFRLLIIGLYLMTKPKIRQAQ